MRSTLCVSIGLVFAAGVFAQSTHQATGVKVGEVTETEAIVWMRVTASAERNDDGRGDFKTFDAMPADEVPIDKLQGACPGTYGRVRVRYDVDKDLASPEATSWVEVGPKTDFAHQFRLTDLKPATTYYYAAETTSRNGREVQSTLRGRFETAPPKGVYADVTFTVVTGQMYRDLDDPKGFHIYEAMRKLGPEFIVPTGDTVYYDNESPVARGIPLARYHWHRMYSLPRVVAFHLEVPGYWEKDDHDTVYNDCWPGVVYDRMLPLTFEQGLELFREQVPMGKLTYRTCRWGKGLQVWMVEGRDFRSPNDMPDGPSKSIWGEKQRKWLMDTILASDADWKVLVSPTPIVGPDRKNKADNHANDAFRFEGDLFRHWVQENVADNFFVACGDRHWQYHSIHPETRMHEFSCGPASDQHAGGSPGKDPTYHEFHRMKGGFLSVNAVRKGDESTIAFRHHDVHGKVVNEFVRSKKVR